MGELDAQITAYELEWWKVRDRLLAERAEKQRSGGGR